MLSLSGQAMPLGFLFFLFLVVVAPIQSYAQFGRLWSASDLAASQETNIFVDWEGGVSFNGFLVDLPASWQLYEVVVLRQGFVSIPLTVESTEPGKYHVTTAQTIRGRHEVILRVRTADYPGAASWSFTPATNVQRDGVDHLVVHQGLAHVRNLIIDEPAVVTANHALRLSESDRAWEWSGENFPAHADEAFTVEGWLQTTRTNRIVLSTWDGTEHTSYPLEIVVDRRGRLRSFVSDGTAHLSMASIAPVADGLWHHFAVTTDPALGKARLILDGTPVDSLSIASIFAGQINGVALGHRLDANAQRNLHIQLFNGQLDEVRIWRIPRTLAQLRRTMRQSLPTNGDNPVIFTFEPQSLSNAQRSQYVIAPSTLAFFTLARGFQAQPEADGVHLTWESSDPNTMAFFIERSTNGRDYARVEEVRARANIAKYYYLDTIVGSQVVYYRLRQLFSWDTAHVAGAVKLGMGGGDEPGAILRGNFPNPFNPQTTISYEVLQGVRVRLSVWDVSGHRIAVLVDEEHRPGVFEASFDGTDLPSGTYLIRLQSSDGQIQTHRMILMK